MRATSQSEGKTEHSRLCTSLQREKKKAMKEYVMNKKVGTKEKCKDLTRKGGKVANKNEERQKWAVFVMPF